MLASLLLSGMVLAGPGGTISYHKKVMIDPDYRPSRTAEEIRGVLGSRTRQAVRNVGHDDVELPPITLPGEVSAASASRAVAVRSVYDQPRVSWNVGLSYGGHHDGWGARVGVGYGYPSTYAYAYSPYAYSSSGSPWNWSIGLGYRTSWGYLGLGYSSAYGCYPYYSGYASCGPRYHASPYGAGRRSYRTYGGRHGR